MIVYCPRCGMGMYAKHVVDRHLRAIKPCQANERCESVEHARNRLSITVNNVITLRHINDMPYIPATDTSVYPWNCHRVDMSYTDVDEVFREYGSGVLEDFTQTCWLYRMHISPTDPVLHLMLIYLVYQVLKNPKNRNLYLWDSTQIKVMTTIGWKIVTETELVQSLVDAIIISALNVAEMLVQHPDIYKNNQRVYSAFLIGINIIGRNPEYYTRYVTVKKIRDYMIYIPMEYTPSVAALKRAVDDATKTLETMMRETLHIGDIPHV